MISLCPILGAVDTVFGAAVTLFQKGGVVMWPLLACSLVALAQSLERIASYLRERGADILATASVEEALDQIAAGDFAKALQNTEKIDSTGTRVIAAGLRQRDIALQDTLNAAAQAEISRLRRGLTILDTIITLAPLLGILGTVTGIIRSFHMLSAGGAQDPAAVTGGIAEALITTAAGLVISIATLIPFNGSVAYVRRRTRELEQLIHRVVVACQRGCGNGA